MLTLPNDGPATGRPLDTALTGDGAAAIVLAIARATPALADRLAAGRLYGDPAAIVGTNESGDRQKALDQGAHDHMIAALTQAGVRQVLSEEETEVATLNPGGAFDVAIDPIDGSGSIGIGAPLGPGGIGIKLRIEDDLCTISIDTSGESLHKRGFKGFTGKAPEGPLGPLLTGQQIEVAVRLLLRD